MRDESSWVEPVLRKTKGALVDFKYTCDSTLGYVCQAGAEKCIFVWTILSQTPRRTLQVTYDAGRISAWIF